MKTLVNRLVMFAASAVVLGTMAYGQTQMKVEIPFAFHTANATLPPGSYVFYGSSVVGTAMILEDAASHRSVLAMSGPVDSHDRASRPSVVFVCVNGGCSLSAIRTANGTLTYPAPHKAARERGAVSVVSIPLTTRNSD